jgi:hypothetical protein
MAIAFIFSVIGQQSQERHFLADKNRMLELSLAYLIAAVLIVGLALLAVRNRKQGWRKNRGAWWEAQSTAAVAAFQSRKTEGPLEHYNDLVRLQQSLTHDTEPAPVESVKR